MPVRAINQGEIDHLLSFAICSLGDLVLLLRRHGVRPSSLILAVCTLQLVRRALISLALTPGVYRTDKGTASVTPRQPPRVMLYNEVISSRSGSTKALRELMQLPARKPEAIRPAQKRNSMPLSSSDLQLTAAAVEGAGIWLCRDTCRTFRMVGRDIDAGDVVIFFTHFTAQTPPSRACSAYDVLFCIS